MPSTLSQSLPLCASVLLFLLPLVLLAFPSSAQIPLPSSAQHLLPGIITPGLTLPSNCTAVFSSFDASTLSLSALSPSAGYTVANDFSTSLLTTITAVAYHVGGATCGSTIQGALTSFASSTTSYTQVYTFAAGLGSSFTLTQPLLTPLTSAPRPGDILDLRLQVGRAALSVYATAKGQGQLQVALLTCGGAVFGLPSSSVLQGPNAVVGPTIPQGCTVVAGAAPFNTAPTTSAAYPVGSTLSLPLTTIPSQPTVNALAVYLAGTATTSATFSLQFQDQNNDGQGDLTQSATYTYQGFGLVTLPVPPLVSQRGSALVDLDINLISGSVVVGGVYAPRGPSGIAEQAMVAALNCPASAFSATGGSVPSVVCPTSSSTGVAAPAAYTGPVGGPYLLPGLITAGQGYPSTCQVVASEVGIGGNQLTVQLRNGSSAQSAFQFPFFSSFTVNAVAFYLRSATCGSVWQGGVIDSQQGGYPGQQFTFPSSLPAGGFTLTQPLAVPIVTAVGDVLNVTYTLSVGNVTAFTTGASGSTPAANQLQTALLICSNATLFTQRFGLVSSTLSASSQAVIGPVIPPTCSVVAAGVYPFTTTSLAMYVTTGELYQNRVDIPLYALASSVSANAIAIHLIGDAALQGAFTLSFEQNNGLVQPSPVVTDVGYGVVTVPVPAYVLPKGSVSVTLTLLNGSVSFASTFVNGGQSYGEVVALNCSASTFTAQGGSEPAVTCPSLLSSSSAPPMAASSSSSSARPSSSSSTGLAPAPSSSSTGVAPAEQQDPTELLPGVLTAGVAVPSTCQVVQSSFATSNATAITLTPSTALQLVAQFSFGSAAFINAVAYHIADAACGSIVQAVVGEQSLGLVFDTVNYTLPTATSSNFTLSQPILPFSTSAADTVSVSLTVAQGSATFYTNSAPSAPQLLLQVALLSCSEGTFGVPTSVTQSGSADFGGGLQAFSVGPTIPASCIYIDGYLPSPYSVSSTFGALVQNFSQPQGQAVNAVSVHLAGLPTTLSAFTLNYNDGASLQSSTRLLYYGGFGALTLALSTTVYTASPPRAAVITVTPQSLYGQPATLTVAQTLDGTAGYKYQLAGLNCPSSAFAQQAGVVGGAQPTVSCPAVAPQLLLPGLVTPGSAVPATCQVLSTTITATSTLTTSLSAASPAYTVAILSLSTSATVNAVALHLGSNACGSVLSGSVSVLSGAGVATAVYATQQAYTLPLATSSSFVLTQPLTSAYSSSSAQVNVSIGVTVQQGSVSLYDGGVGALEVALLSCAAGTFGVPASAIAQDSRGAVGPTTPQGCAVVAGGVPQPSSTSVYTSSSATVNAQGPASATTANAVAVYLNGLSAAASAAFQVLFPIASTSALSSPISVTGFGVFTVSLLHSIYVPGGSSTEPIVLQLLNGTLAVASGGFSGLQIAALNCPASALTAQGGSVPAVVCPASSTGAPTAFSSTAVSSSSSTGAGSMVVSVSQFAAVSSPSGVVYDGVDPLYISDSSTQSVLKFDLQGDLLANFSGDSFTPPLSYPAGLAVDSTGLLYVVDAANSLVYQFTSGGSQRQVFSTDNPPLAFPLAIAIGPGDALLVADTFNDRVVQFYPNGTLQLVLDTGAFNLSEPAGLAVGADGTVFIADRGNARILVVSPNGVVSVLPVMGLGLPAGLAVDNESGRLFIADTDGQVLVVNSTTGAALAVLTSGSGLSAPTAVTVDGQGNVYVADPLGMFVGAVNAASLVETSMPMPTPSSTSSSSTGAAAAYSDPRFVGFWGQSFFVGGRAGGVYNLLSDADVQVNAHFVQLSNVTCPLVDGRAAERCYVEAGTYFGVLSVMVRGGAYVRITGGGHDEGFHSVRIQDQISIEVGDSWDGAAMGHGEEGQGVVEAKGAQRLLLGRKGGAANADSGEHSPTSPTFTVHRPSHRSLHIRAGVYELQVVNMDQYVDVATLDVSCWQCVVEQLRPEGLLGQTWNATASVKHSEDEVEQYRERDDHLLGCKHRHDRFCSAQHQQARP